MVVLQAYKLEVEEKEVYQLLFFSVLIWTDSTFYLLCLFLY